MSNSSGFPKSPQSVLRRSVRLSTSVCAASLLTVFGSLTTNTAQALGPLPEFRKQELKPSTRYSGSAPIDMSHGLLGQNGTFGLPNPDYEAWSQAPTIGVSLSQKSYAYAMRDKLIATLDERLNFYRDALWNLRQKAKNANAAVEEGYKAKAPGAIEAPLKEARSAWEELRSAGESGWAAAEAKAKEAFSKLQSDYYSLHR
jgi:hypothetical protein